MVTRKCIICGKLFEARANTITCSVKCRKINNRKVNNHNHEKAYREKMKLQKELENCRSPFLDIDIANAHKRGISYGKYKAMQYLGQIKEGD